MNEFKFNIYIGINVISNSLIQMFLYKNLKIHIKIYILNCSLDNTNGQNIILSISLETEDCHIIKILNHVTIFHL